MELTLTEAEQFFDDLVRERRLRGRQTYGGGLDHRDQKYDWDRMALEEAMDLAQYLMAENRRLHELIETVIRNCMECYDKRECQSCAWLREGTEKKR